MTATALAGEQDFARVADPYRRELLAHCYRMTGSLHDAEDLVQDTYLRAWRAYSAFEQRSSLRTWLYSIATNVCLTELKGKAKRPLPTGLGAPQAHPSDDLVERPEVPWLEPVPDVRVTGEHEDPAAIAGERATIRLAFVAALQLLPPRQRAVLILRDVLMWRAAEVAAALELSTAAVNSLLQRARTRLADAKATEDTVTEPTDPEQAQLLERYVTAFWEKDIDAIVSMLTAEAVWEMPPFASWFRGAADIGRLIDGQCPGGRHDMKMVQTWANGQPAYGLYMRDVGDRFLPFQLQVLSLRDGLVDHVVAFFDTALFPAFDLPPHL